MGASTDTTIDSGLAQRTAERAARVLYEQDRASQSLGMHITRIAPGEAELTMQVRPDMTNGHHICHGGLVFALADSAFAFAPRSEEHTSELQSQSNLVCRLLL